MRRQQSKLFTLLVLFGFIVNACSSNSDNRILGSIEGKTYTVDSFLSMFLSPDMLKEHRKEISDTDIAAGFEQYASFVVFAAEADKNNFFEKNPSFEQEYNTQKKNISMQTMVKFVQDKYINPLADKVNLTSADLAPYKKRVQVRHILLSNQGSMKDPKKGEALKQEIIKQFNNGTPFADLAKKYSEDPGSKDAGGLISSWIYEKNSPFVPEFTQAALSAKKEHELIPDVKTSFGTHLIYIESIQNRSEDDIKKNDPQIYNQVLSEKKNEVTAKFTDKLVKEYDVQQSPDIDLIEYFTHYSENTADKVLYSYKMDGKTVTYTGKEFVDQFMSKGDLKPLQKVLKENPKYDLNTFFRMNVIQPLLLQDYAKTHGFEKDSLNSILQTQLVALKANFYIKNLLDEKGPKTSKGPNKKEIEKTITMKDIIDFYNTNKDLFKQPDGSFKNIKDKAIQDEVKSFIINDKMNQTAQNGKQSIMEFIAKEAQSLYPTYKVVFDTNFLKKDSTKNAPAEKQK